MPQSSEPRSLSPEPFFIALAAIALMIPVLLPLIVVFAPTLYLDADPRGLGDMAAQTISFGPTGIMWLAGASILIAALVMGITAWAGGRIRWGACLAIALGIVPCLWHMPYHFTSRLQCAAYLAAACLGLAAFHLAQFERARRLCISALIAVALSLALQSIWYVYVEHPDTVRSFQSSLEQTLTARGLDPDSPEAMKYQTRLMGSDAIGAVGMSNIQGSIVASLLPLALITLIAGWRSKAKGFRMAALVILMTLSAWTLKLTQSKGALLALVAALALGVLLGLIGKAKPKRLRIAPVLCVLLIASGVAAVLVRGAIGPPQDHLGERSLLFRYHYWQGAAHMLIDKPTDALLGVGPGPFKDRYESVRNPISPEVISSTHNVFVDYTVMLGLGGMIWGMLLLVWLWRSGRAWRRPLQPPSDQQPTPSDKPLRWFALLAAVLFLIQYAVQFPSLYAQTAILWLISALGFVAIAAYVVYPILIRPNASHLIPIALSLAAVLLLLHAQIEMTFFWISSVGFVWLVLALAAGSSVGHTGSSSKHNTAWRYLPGAVLLILALVFSVLFAEPTTRQQQHLRQASDTLRLTANPAAAMQQLDAAAQIIPNDPTTTRWRVQLRQEIAAALWQVGRQDDANMLINQSLSLLDEAHAAGLTELTTDRLSGNLAYNSYQFTGDREYLHLAEQTYLNAVKRSPNNLYLAVRLGDIAWDLADFSAAETSYKRALLINDNDYLDPDAQLSEIERKRIESRLIKAKTDSLD